MKATQKRYVDCQKNPHHVFNHGDVDLIIGKETWEGVTIQSRDGKLQYHVSAYMHGGNLVLDISTNTLTVVVGDFHGEIPRRKILAYQGNPDYLKQIELRYELGETSKE